MGGKDKGDGKEKVGLPDEEEFDEKRLRDQEMNMLRRVQGEHVVRLIAELESTEKGPAIVMELCSGSVEAEMGGAGLGKERFLEVIEQILEGLVWFHERNYVYGDLKPDNLLMRRGSNRIVFSDFGCSRCLDDAGPQSGPYGDPLYMAFWDVENTWMLTKPSDVWMVAQCAHALWTGAAPWDNPQVLPAEIPLRELLLRCHEVDPAARPTAQELLDAVRGVRRNA
eukprot:NODE_3065_length_835_cov_286.938462.p1 GENE.NODE_3065_length_835_cov_286.938462~~NODE_3065_length_835_cov_286.938462.p1  ORF type:complete len:225 (+),score=79.40 NODE_3065_length_835_cov_286.938462:3-677(+)